MRSLDFPGKSAQQMGTSQPPALSRVSATVSASFDNHIEMCLTLLWVCASFRPSSHKSLSFPTLYADTSENPNGIVIGATTSPSFTHLGGEPYFPFLLASLFSNMVIALDFPIPHRNHGIGLGISFSDMIHFARSLNIMEHENGVVEGPKFLIIPMKELTEDVALQWRRYSRAGNAWSHSYC